MLYENNKPSLSRLQLFAWTWISAIVFISLLFSTINSLLNNPQNLNLPDLNPTFLLLMGISNGAYLSAKAQNKSLQITSIFPEKQIKIDTKDKEEKEDLDKLKSKMEVPEKGNIKMGIQEVGEHLSIFGTNFSHTNDKVWFDDMQFPFKETDIKNIISWQPTGDRVDIVLPNDLKENEIYMVRVANGGFLSQPYPLKVKPKKNQETKSSTNVSKSAVKFL